MNSEFFEALALLEKERNVPADYLLEKIRNAIVIAVKRDYGDSDNIHVDIDPEKQNFKVYIAK
ncbi:MAG: NusA N-terminal domain-containing protein, partial [Oscillospiraceae bacterium]